MDANETGRSEKPVGEAKKLCSPPSRREVLKTFALVPLALPAMGKAWKFLLAAPPPSSQCCKGTFRPNDLFAGKSVKGDLQRARRGDLAATLRVGFAYYTGMAGFVDIERARAYFLIASHTSLAGAAWLGYLDAAVRIKPRAAARNSSTFKALVSAAEASDPVAQTLLGRVYERGLAGYRRRPDKARPLFAAAAPNFALAKTYLGRLLLKSGSTDDAISLFQDAAKAGETTAMISLADLYSRRKQPTTKTAEVKRLLRVAGKKGDRVALYLLAMQYQEGTPGATPNPQRALTLLRQAAVRGNRPAQNALAAAYAAGAGGTTSEQLARFWARKASLPSLAKLGPPVAPGQQRPSTAS